MSLKHSDEFKRDAVRIALTSGLTRRQVASDLSIGLSTLGKWIASISDETKIPTQDTDLLREPRRAAAPGAEARREKATADRAAPTAGRSHRISRKIRLKWPSCTSGRAVFLPDRRRGFFLPEPHADLPPRTPRGGFFSPRSSIAASDDAETTRPRTSSCSIAIADDGTRSPAVATDLELASPHPTMRAGVDHRQV